MMLPAPTTDSWAEPPADIFQMTVAPEAAKSEPEYRVIGFESGVPVSVDGEKLSAVELLDNLNRAGGVVAVGKGVWI